MPHRAWRLTFCTSAFWASKAHAGRSWMMRAWYQLGNRIPLQGPPPSRSHRGQSGLIGSAILRHDRVGCIEGALGVSLLLGLCCHHYHHHHHHHHYHHKPFIIINHHHHHHYHHKPFIIINHNHHHNQHYHHHCIIRHPLHRFRVCRSPPPPPLQHSTHWSLQFLRPLREPMGAGGVKQRKFRWRILAWTWS